MSDKEGLKAFYEHCCVTRHYFFSIKKCGQEGCEVCKPVHMPKDEFMKIKHLPDPMLGEKDHYLPFCVAFKKNTSECDRPSLAKTSKKLKPLPFSASVQHVKNIGVMLQCEECDLWRLLYSKRKLSVQDKTEIQSFLDDIAYTCGATLQDLNLPEKFSCVYIREHSCSDPVEKLYYSAGYAPICIYCAEEDVEDSDEYYPICSTCLSVNEKKSTSESHDLFIFCAQLTYFLVFVNLPYFL